ncbi:hypothetical protein [Nitratiruptor sp. YY09-18]|uniref:hypothetical protein n=1 Tax=Nitratiruptor sp. YY09-18 TaxID=2724901 RepID=UPI001915002B|nr:hypothetical protein [Nitratiruptor sp. YY09-18]BCD68094.1 hypothetical protein NitYY0918_C1005 [Nitratiruptor sp. YY09-18]
MSKYKDIDLSNIINIYPSIYIDHEGERTTISLEWYEENKESVSFVSFALILLFQDGSKKELFFDTHQELLQAMHDIANILKK